jgi:hypothetical protein
MQTEADQMTDQPPHPQASRPWEAANQRKMNGSATPQKGLEPG